LALNAIQALVRRQGIYGLTQEPAVTLFAGCPTVQENVTDKADRGIRDMVLVPIYPTVRTA
jgi:hypothetical protein